MTGPEALLAFQSASKAVAERRYDDALAVEMLPSDRAVIEARIAAVKQAASASS